MLIAAVFIFLLAAVFGLVLLIAVFQDRVPNSKALVFHGLFAVTGVVLMIIYISMYGAPHMLRTSFILFVIAAIGGLSLFLLGRSGKAVPKVAVLVHPLLAFVAIVTLLMFILP